MTNLLQSILDSFTDIAENPISITIFIVLAAIIFALLLAIVFPTWKTILIRTKILDKEESPSSLLGWFLITIIIVKLVQAFVVQPFIVEGGSMLPTFHNKEFLLVDKFSYLAGNPKRGDVIIFKLYEGEGNAYTGKYLIKRVIGLPGEHVVVKNGITTIYNKEHLEGFTLDESYVAYKDTSKDIDITLDETHYFVMGDNRAQSYDSRSWGPLDRKDIRGQVFTRLLPISTISYEPGRVNYDK